MNQDLISNELINIVEYWLSGAKRVGMAILVATKGSTPMPIGSFMIVNDSGENYGSVSGGCVEPTVVEEIIQLLSKDSTKSEPGLPKLATFSYSDDVAYNFGLTCGGTVKILVFEPNWAIFLSIIRRLLLSDWSILGLDFSTGRLFGLCHLDGSLRYLYSNNSELEEEQVISMEAVDKQDYLKSVAMKFLHTGLTSGLFDVNLYELSFAKSDIADNVDSYVVSDESLSNEALGEYFFYRFEGKPKLIIVGVSDHVVALSYFGVRMGYEVYVVDPRPIFLTPPKFDPAVNLIVKWPDVYISEIAHTITKQDAICVLSHDDKFDLPTLTVALNLPFGYIGAMGSRKTTEKRNEKLRNMGVAENKITSIKSPIGLDLGATNSNEIALSIIAHIIANKNNRQGVALFETTGKITSDR